MLNTNPVAASPWSSLETVLSAAMAYECFHGGSEFIRRNVLAANRVMARRCDLAVSDLNVLQIVHGLLDDDIRVRTTIDVIGGVTNRLDTQPRVVADVEDAMRALARNQVIASTDPMDGRVGGKCREVVIALLPQPDGWAATLKRLSYRP